VEGRSVGSPRDRDDEPMPARDSNVVSVVQIGGSFADPLHHGYRKAHDLVLRQVVDDDLRARVRYDGACPSGADLYLKVTHRTATQHRNVSGHVASEHCLAVLRMARANLVGHVHVLGGADKQCEDVMVRCGELLTRCPAATGGSVCGGDGRRRKDRGCKDATDTDPSNGPHFKRDFHDLSPNLNLIVKGRHRGQAGLGLRPVTERPTPSPARPVRSNLNFAASGALSLTDP
jgi:hypothetical protein